MSERIEVRVRDCACPDNSHPDGDVVYVAPKMSLECGAAAEVDLQLVADIADDSRRAVALMVRWTATYVRYGATGWNFKHVDPDSGKTVDQPFDVEELLADYSLSRAVAEKANELYGNGAQSPLFRGAVPDRPQRRSPTGPTGSSTSRRRERTPKPSASSSAPSSDGPQLRAIG